MRMIGSAVSGIGRFLYRFIVGDDWRVAVAMLVALVLTGVLVAQKLPAWWLVPVVAILMTGVSLRRSAAA